MLRCNLLVCSTQHGVGKPQARSWFVNVPHLGFLGHDPRISVLIAA